jgi:hypothetical protein
MATSFTISRRRSMVPIYKKWEASLARVQIVRQEKVVQLLAFFGEFQHGTCMNFVLKGTDIMESFGRSGKFGIRMVDAKFALPKKDEDPASNFLCLDMPEYPIEHDDITITFDTEASKCSSSSDKYLECITNHSSPRDLQGSTPWIGERAISNGLHSPLIPNFPTSRDYSPERRLRDFPLPEVGTVYYI